MLKSADKKKSANVSACTGQMCTYIKSKTENGKKS